MTYVPPKVEFKNQLGRVLIKLDGVSGQCFASASDAFTWSFDVVQVAVLLAGKHPTEARKETYKLLSEAWDAYHAEEAGQ